MRVVNYCSLKIRANCKNAKYWDKTWRSRRAFVDTMWQTHCLLRHLWWDLSRPVLHSPATSWETTFNCWLWHRPIRLQRLNAFRQVDVVKTTCLGFKLRIRIQYYCHCRLLSARGGSCDRKRGDLNMVGCWSEYNTRCWSTGIFKHSHLQGFQKIRENIQWTAVVRRKLLYPCQMVKGEWSDWMETIRRTTGTQITTSVCRKSPLNVQHVQEM